MFWVFWLHWDISNYFKKRSKIYPLIFRNTLFPNRISSEAYISLSHYTYTKCLTNIIRVIPCTYIFEYRMIIKPDPFLLSNNVWVRISGRLYFYPFVRGFILKAVLSSRFTHIIKILRVVLCTVTSCRGARNVDIWSEVYVSLRTVSRSSRMVIERELGFKMIPSDVFTLQFLSQYVSCSWQWWFSLYEIYRTWYFMVNVV